MTKRLSELKIAKMCRIIGIMSAVALGLALPATAQAKWSKASSHFSYDGVSVQVTDRHKEIGAPYDTYGYTTYINRKDSPVTVNWACYGVLKKGGKLVCVDEGQFIMFPQKEHSEVYSYDGGLFTHRDFKTYVVSIEVIDGIVTPEQELTGTPVKDDDGGKVTEDNEDEVYERVTKHINGTVTQQDYADALAWLFYTLEHKMGPFWDMQEQERLKGNHSTHLVEQNQELIERWKFMIFFVVSANTENRLNDENAKEYQRLSTEIDKYGN